MAEIWWISMTTTLYCQAPIDLPVPAQRDLLSVASYDWQCHEQGTHEHLWDDSELPQLDSLNPPWLTVRAMKAQLWKELCSDVLSLSFLMECWGSGHLI